MAKVKDLNFLPIDEKMKKTCEELGLYDPTILLVALANGRDLTEDSEVYRLLKEHEEEFGDEPPDEFQWVEFKDAIKRSLQFAPVSETTKFQSQRTLAEYLHNKKKSVEVTDKSQQAAITSLSSREVRRFKRIFNKEF